MLNERKTKILEAIINDYIQTAEPIGSRTIAKKYGLGISSATIRNEMSDLEEMGYILQPYASAGRVPSDMGYRFYVDQLMSRPELAEDDAAYLQEIVRRNINHIDYLMQETAKALAVLTNYTTIVSEPKAKSVKVKHLQFVPFDDASVIMVLVTDTKVIKNKMVELIKVPADEALSALSAMLNSQLAGCDAEAVVKKVQTWKDGEFPEALVSREQLCAMMTALVEQLQDENDVHVYTSGVKNILGFPEFSDIEKALPLFQALEEKDMLITLLGDTSADRVQIVIGEENTMSQMKECSIIKANYSFGQRISGSIGVIGPTRMNYPQVVAMLNTIVKNINTVLKALAGG